MGEFSEELAGGAVVGVGGFDFGAEGAEIDVLSVVADSGVPGVASFVVVDALVDGGAGAAFVDVLHVLLVRAVAHVGPAVVQTIAPGL